MRDKKDRATFEMHPPKLGRPCLDPEKGPMSPAEKQRRYRELRRLRAGRIAAQADNVLNVESEDYLETALSLTDAVLLDAIRKESAFLGDQEARGSRRGVSRSKKRIGALVAELSRRYPES